MSIVAKLKIPKYEDLSVNSANSEDPLEDLITKYKDHPSIGAILDKSPNTLFSLKAISKKDMKKEILNLNVAKAFQDSDIPTKIIKKNSDIFSDILFKEFNKSLETCKFPSCLKMAYVTLPTKKGIVWERQLSSSLYFTEFVKNFWKVFIQTNFYNFWGYHF